MVFALQYEWREKTGEQKSQINEMSLQWDVIFV